MTSETATAKLHVETTPAAHQDRLSIPRQIFLRLIAAIEILADLGTCFVAMIAAYFLSIRIEHHAGYSLRNLISTAIFVSLGAVFFLYKDGAYRGSGSLLQVRETERVIRISLESLVILFPLHILLHIALPSTAILIAFLFAPVLFILQKNIFFRFMRFLYLNGHGVERVVVYGSGDTGRLAVTALMQSPRLGLFPAAVVDDTSTQSIYSISEMGYKNSLSIPVLRGPVTPHLLKSLHCRMLIAAIPAYSVDRLDSIYKTAQQSGADFAFLSSFFPHEHIWDKSVDIDGLLLFSTGDLSTSCVYRFTKRALDILISSTLLILISPFLLLIALLIKLDSPGPVLFVQERVGMHGKLFSMYKFRSMYADANRYELSPTSPFDSRITRVGRILRRASLDELPQLINVLFGTMSLVGPRPEMPFIAEGYTPSQCRRLQVIPGITGLWQLSADRAFQIHGNIQYDFYYIRNRSFFLDVAILVHTLFFAMSAGI